MRRRHLSREQIQRILELRQHVLTGNDRIQGWLQRASALAIWGVLERQIIDGIDGDVLEIGVYHGKTFILMVKSLSAAQQAVAVDTFEMEFNVEGRREMVQFRGTFEDNMATFCSDKNVSIRHMTSQAFGKTIGEDHYGRYRMISIDGSHAAVDVLSDLQIAERLLADRGIVVVDDYMSLVDPGVVEGVYQYLTKTGPRPTKLVPVLVVEGDQPSESNGGHRLFMCRAEAFEFYSQVLFENHPDKIIRVTVADEFPTKILRFSNGVYKRRFLDYEELQDA